MNANKTSRKVVTNMTQLTMKYGYPSAVVFLSAALMGTAAAQTSSSPIDPNNAVQVGSSGDAEHNKQLLEELRLMGLLHRTSKIVR
jgi:hypothetical protein